MSDKNTASSTKENSKKPNHPVKKFEFKKNVTSTSNNSVKDSEPKKDLEYKEIEKTNLNESESPNTQDIKETDNKIEKIEVVNSTFERVQNNSKKEARPIIQVINLVKKYNDFCAVNDISFEVKKGEIFGILGPNGAGKTTTLEIIETLNTKTSGKVLVDGLDVDLYPEQVKNLIGVQLQSSGFYSKITLSETLNMFAGIFNVKIRTDAILEKFNLLEKKDQTVDELSGGQKQRFSIATTLVASPEIVFLDEPTTGLDPQARRNLWDIILDLKTQGKTVVLTTHYMDEAEQLCDRIAIMDSGKILEISTAEILIKELLRRGFKRPQPKLGATLEDVFLDLTGKEWRD